MCTGVVTTYNENEKKIVLYNFLKCGFNNIGPLTSMILIYNIEYYDWCMMIKLMNKFVLLEFSSNPVPTLFMSCCLAADRRFDFLIFYNN